MDRISNLPDEIICHIVSFLSAKEAAFALVLSKRWLNLFTITPRLRFKDWSKKVQGSLIDFLNGVIALPLSSRIKEVSLRCRERVDSVLINRFLCNVLKRGILFLSVELDLTLENGYSLPSEIFTCKTIVELKLGKGFHIAMVPDNASLPSLKIIDLDHVRIKASEEMQGKPLSQKEAPANKVWVKKEKELGQSETKPIKHEDTAIQTQYVSASELQRLPATRDKTKGISDRTSSGITTHNRFKALIRFFNHIHGCAFEALLSACPVLEGLFIYGVDWEHWKWSATISIPTRQKLVIKRTDYNGFDASDFRSITFDTPSLVCLIISDFVPNEYPIANVDSVVEAKLDLFPSSCWPGAGHNGDPLSSDPTNLIKGLRNVKILKLVRLHTVAMLYYFREAIPVFHNLLHLTVPTSHGDCWKTMPILVTNSPNLKTLVIHGPFHYDRHKPESVCECLSGYSWLSSCPVEVLEIMSFMGAVGDVEQLKHFLWKLPHLELVKIRVWETDDEAKLKLTTDLQMLPRASVNCKIQVNFS